MTTNPQGSKDKLYHILYSIGAHYDSYPENKPNSLDVPEAVTALRQLIQEKLPKERVRGLGDDPIAYGHNSCLADVKRALDMVFGEGESGLFGLPESPERRKKQP